MVDELVADKVSTGSVTRRETWSWSSGQGRRLAFKRLWVQIPALDTGWTFFTLYCWKNCNFCLKKAEINKKEAENCPFFNFSRLVLLSFGTLWWEYERRHWLDWSIACTLKYDCTAGLQFYWLEFNCFTRYIQKTTYFLCRSSPVLLNWTWPAAAVQRSFPPTHGECSPTR